MASETRVFPLAPMSPLIGVLTVVVLCVPLVLAVVALSAPGAGAEVLTYTSWALVALYVLVFLWFRPTRFEVDAKSVHIVWPLRRSSFPKSDIKRARRMTSREFRQEFGLGMRIGVGGLYGAFGLLKTTRGGMMDLYISRHDWLVVLERHSSRPLLLTPDDASRFVEAVTA